VLPLLQAEVVPPGWVSNEAFLEGYGAAQAWHYSLDCYAGFLGAAMIYGAVGAVQRWHARIVAPEPAVRSAHA